MDVFEAVVRDHRPFLRQAAVNAGHDLGLYDALADGATAAALAGRLEVGARRLRALLDVLALEGVLRRDGDVFRRAGTPPAAAPLPPEGFGAIATVLRSDRPLAAPDAASYHDHLLAVGASVARELANAVVPAEARHVLDVGCGAGAYAAAILDLPGDREVTLVDEAPVLDRARAHLGDRAHRATFLPGDVRDVAPTAQHDLALLANVLHLHGPADGAAIVGASARALAPGGRLVVKDLVVAADRSGPPVALWFALDMALYTERGDVYTEAEVAGWMAAAGLVDVQRHHLRSSPDALVLVGRVPDASPSSPALV